MLDTTRTSRLAMRSAAAVAALLCSAVLASAADLDKVTYMTSWYAQAEHGGFYQAKATGLYEAEGLDVTVKMGGPQINGMQLLLAGESDFYNGFDFQVLSGVEQGLPVKAVAAMFQHDVNGMLTHKDVTGLDGLKDKTLMIATTARASWWPWLKTKYGLEDSQVKPYTFNVQPFLVDPQAAQQAFPSSEPFTLEQQNVPYNFFLFADEGYPPYGITLVTRSDVIKDKPDVVERFVRASVKGWKSYLEDPAPGNALIKEANPKMTDEQLAFALKSMKDLQLVTGGDAAAEGIGTMKEERWKASYDYMVSAGLLKPETNWKDAFTTEFVKGLGVKPD